MRRLGVLGLALAMALSACSSLESIIGDQSAIESNGTPTTATAVGQPLVTDDANPSTTSEAPAEGEEQSESTTTDLTEPPVFAGPLSVNVLNTYPHDSTAYAEGMEISQGYLIESTGLYGSSSRRRVDPTSGSVVDKVDLEPELYGSGLTFHNGTGIQVTRSERIVVLFDVADLREFDRFTIESEGWGVCADAETVFLSNGTSTLSKRDPMSFLETGSLAVTQDGAPIDKLAELECVGTQIWAVLWPTNQLVQIGQDGAVTASADLSSLVPEGLSVEDALAAIAYNEETHTFFVTGKRWPSVFEVSFSEA